MSKRVNFSGEPSKRARPAISKAKQMEILRKNSGEKKGVDSSLAYSPVIATTSTSAGIFVPNCVAPGNGSYNRIGRKAFLKSLRIKGTAAFLWDTSSTGNVTDSVLRMMVVWDKQPCGALPNFDDIFGVTDQTGAETSTYSDPPRYDNMSRFQVLMDKSIACHPALNGLDSGTGNTLTWRFLIDEFVKLNNRTTVYGGQSSPCTIADIANGGLYVIFRSSDVSAGVYQWSIEDDTIARLRYTD